MEAEIIAQDLMCAGNLARLVLAHDVTAQRQLQKELLKSQKAAVTARLAGGVADNFSRLISAIEEDANAVLRKCQEPEVIEPLKRISGTAGAASRLTQQLLALVGRHPMRQQTIDLNRLVDEQSRAFGGTVGGRITVEKDCRADLPPVSADPTLVEEILQNLIRNAKESMPDGGSLKLGTATGRLDVATARRHEGARPGPYVSLSVSDTGCGMTEEVQSRLFEPFFTTKRKAAGLGLATVHGLVEQHSGWIEVNSEPGLGSVVTVFFPCSSPAPVAAT